jgi:hypothetical protein
VTFCAFETIREPTTADKMRREQLSVCENWLQISEMAVKLCMSSR